MVAAKIPLANPVYKVVMQGHIVTAQPWSVGFYLQSAGGTAPTQNNVTTNVGAFTTLITTLWSQLKTLCNGGTVFDEVSTYYYPAGSLVATLLAHDTFTAVPGTDASSELPSQLAIVCSLRSSTPGRSGRGRMYFPVTGGAHIDTGQLDSASCTLVATNVALMLTAFNASTPAEGGTLKAGVASFTKGQFYPIVTTICDSKIDTQRRREDQISVLRTANHVV